ncbi:FAD/NAD(P)-binding domain-containing protein [Amniculicola lignicola CBS 123094]|uniref:FAD/NAD(P)-binding domain-containing protein n=1 Tax=Amniculicola lignicola CBS 123094 TaxID=1392246 RepID=A0A6A5WHW8_9PLEO|nr:FAD/NAD(P)-binding domain-containing protein [Amniculicola lignicola CBS 123094]
MHIHDVIIIGGGPCGLAIASRLREHTPSATFTDDEHQRYHWIRKHGQKMNIKNYRSGADYNPKFLHKPHAKDGLDMLVIDAEGAKWMTRWNRLFKTFSITHLRSPMFFHVDPADRDALLAYTHENCRQCELQELPGCVGKEMSKHRKKQRRKGSGRISQSGPDIDERDRHDYFTPSSSLFDAHCSKIVDRYQLYEGMIRHDAVLNIEYTSVSSFDECEVGSDISNCSSPDDESAFRLTTRDGVYFARIVVLAVGPGNAPSIPSIPGLLQHTLYLGHCHAMQLNDFPSPSVKNKIAKRASTNILIVGGGLTSIQLADLALKRGVTKVWLLMRGPLKVKYFDIDLDWVGKFRNVNQASFWSADTDEERLEMFLQARNGGSITPRYRKILDKHIASGKIVLHTHTTLKSVQWVPDTHIWTSVVSSPSVSFPEMDYIVFATGVQSDIRTLPFLQKFQKEHPIDCVGSLPCLNDDLMWNDDVPLFVTGRLAGLRLGPGAPNLVGARVGAERIAWNISDILENRKEKNSVGKGVEGYEKEALTQYASGRRNRFDSLIDGH